MGDIVDRGQRGKPALCDGKTYVRQRVTIRRQGIRSIGIANVARDVGLAAKCLENGDVAGAMTRLLLLPGVRGEFAIRRRSVSETTHGNAAAKRVDQAQQEQGVLHRCVALAWHRRASGAREKRCNSPEMHPASTSDPLRSRRRRGRDILGERCRSAVRRTETGAYGTDLTSSIWSTRRLASQR